MLDKPVAAAHDALLAMEQRSCSAKGWIVAGADFHSKP